jgi:hypothetical protein
MQVSSMIVSGHISTGSEVCNTCQIDCLCRHQNEQKIRTYIDRQQSNMILYVIKLSMGLCKQNNICYDRVWSDSDTFIHSNIVPK